MPAALHVSEGSPKKSARRARRTSAKQLDLTTAQKKLILNSFFRLEPAAVAGEVDQIDVTDGVSGRVDSVDDGFRQVCHSRTPCGGKGTHLETQYPALRRRG